MLVSNTSVVALVNAILETPHDLAYGTYLDQSKYTGGGERIVLNLTVERRLHLTIPSSDLINYISVHKYRGMMVINSAYHYFFYIYLFLLYIVI